MDTPPALRQFLLDMQRAIAAIARASYEDHSTYAETDTSESFLDLEITSTSSLYLGDSATDGSWRIVRSGNDLVIQRRESGTWTTKSTISA